MSTELKRILNHHEEATHQRLRLVCDAYGSHVYAKLRVADVIPIENSGISDDLYRYALQSHFDFVVTDNLHKPAFAVEFDGPTHQSPVQRKRDKKKDELCDRFNLPLLRVNARYLGKQYRDMDLLTWFVEVWFAQKWFEQAQNKGEIAYDEPFMPQAIVNIPGSNKQFPLWLSAVVRAKIQKLCFAGTIKDFVPSVLIGIDTEGNYHALSFIRIDDSRGVVVETGMRLKRFPVLESEALDEIIIFQLYEALVRALEVGDTASPGAEIERRISDFAGLYKMAHVFHTSSSYDIPSAGSRR